MRKLVFAGAMALALAAGMTTGAVAFDEGAGISGSVRSLHANGVHSHSFRRDSRMAGIRGYESLRHGGWGYAGAPHGGFVDLGPLGITAGCGHGSCSPGYSVSAWSW